MCMEEKTFMTISDAKDEELYHVLKKVALKNGVFSDFFEYDTKHPEHPDSGVYFVVCPDMEPLLELRRNPLKIKDIIEDYKKHDANHVINPYYGLVNISYTTNENILAVHNDMCKVIQNISIVRNAFYEFGYVLPDHITDQMIDVIYDMDKQRNNEKMPPELQEHYKKGYKRLIGEINQTLNKKSIFPFLNRESQKVPANYFLKHHIPAIYETVDDKFWAFLKERIKDHPEFKYYKEKRPSLHLKDLSKKYDGPESMNFWENDKEYNEYNIGFPMQFQHIFYRAVTEYNMIGNDQYIDIETLKKSSAEPLEHFVLNAEDVDLFNAYCSSNGHMQFSIDYDQYDVLDSSITDRIIVAYRAEDSDNFSDIVSSMGMDSRCYIPTTCVQRKKAEENRPQDYPLPFFDREARAF